MTATFNVAGGDADQSKPLPVARLDAENGISKSTLVKLVSKKSARECGNSDLETLCRLAGALKIPPGLLLMSQAATNQAAQMRKTCAKLLLSQVARNPVAIF